MYLDFLYNSVKHIYKTLDICTTVAYEFTLYCYYKNYTQFITNLAFKLSQKNILYVKVFQSIALNNNLIDEQVNLVLTSYTDNVPYTNYDIDFHALHKCASDFNLKYYNNNAYPINSGMISIVFRMIDSKTNKDIILKMRRKNIEEKLAEGIDYLKFIMNILSFIPLFNSFEIPSVINKNIGIIMQQTNFAKEVSNIELMREKSKNLDYIRVPFVYREATEKYPNIILMEYIDGENIKDVDISDYEEYAKLVIKFGFISVFYFGLSHGDLHSGNILFIKNDNLTDAPKYQLGIIDLGIMIEISEIVSNHYLDLFIDLFSVSCEITAKKLITNILLEPKEILDSLPEEHYTNIIKLGSNVIESLRNNNTKLDQSELYNYFHIINNYFKSNDLVKLGLRPSGEFMKIQLALAMTHGVTLQLCKENPINLIKNVLNEILNLDFFLEDD